MEPFKMNYSGKLARRILKENGLLKCELLGCGFEDCVDMAHVLARRDGGTLDIDTNILILCPNHHRMFDEGILKINPKKILASRKWKFTDLIKDGARTPLPIDDRDKEKIEECKRIMEEREMILNTIDVNVWGWQAKLARKWKLSHRQTIRFIKKYFPEVAAVAKWNTRRINRVSFGNASEL